MEWSRAQVRRDPIAFSDLIEHAASQLGAAPEDFPHLTSSARERLALELDRIALARAASANTAILKSPLVSKWLEESSVGDDTINLRHRALMIALGDLATRLVKRRPCGPIAEIDAAGLRLAVELHQLRPGRIESSSTPWNADLCRRVIFIRAVGQDLTLVDVLQTERGD